MSRVSGGNSGGGGKVPPAPASDHDLGAAPHGKEAGATDSDQ